MSNRQNIGLIIGLLIFVILLFLPASEQLGAAGQRAAAVAILMAVWWISEVIPIYVTAFLPLFLRFYAAFRNRPEYSDFWKRTGKHPANGPLRVWIECDRSGRDHRDDISGRFCSFPNVRRISAMVAIRK
jgi:hypothetical protein